MTSTGRRIGWLDASAGVSGDMLLGACLDAGVGPDTIQGAIDALHLPEAITVNPTRVQRGGLAATYAPVATGDATHARHLGDIVALLDAADLAGSVRTRAIAVFEALAKAEARVHDQPVSSVHFHEVGALDSIADVVGAVAGLDALGIDHLVCSAIGLGGGRTATGHGMIPVPGPAVLELLRAAHAPGVGGPIDVELATPTGVAIAVTLADEFGPLPAVRPEAIGVGAGRRDPIGHTNVTRLVLGREHSAGSADHDGASAVVIETNIDDFDPRLWTPTLNALLAAGASDAWLTPILMKKGRPAHTLSVLASADHIDRVERAIFTHTSTIGVRRYPVGKAALDREERVVEVAGNAIRVKIARLDGQVMNANPEYEDVLAAAASSGRPPKVVMDQARAAIVGVYTEE